MCACSAARFALLTLKARQEQAVIHAARGCQARAASPEIRKKEALVQAPCFLFSNLATSVARVC